MFGVIKKNVPARLICSRISITPTPVDNLKFSRSDESFFYFTLHNFNPDKS